MPLQRGLFSLFHRLHWHVFDRGQFDAIWIHLAILHHFTTFHHSIYVEDTAQKMVSFTSYRCFTSCISRLATFPNPRIDEPINRTSNFSEDVAALAAPGSKEGKTMENMETCWGRCVFFMQILQTWSNAGDVAGRSQGEREEKAWMDSASPSVDGWTQMPWIEVLKNHIPQLCHCMIVYVTVLLLWLPLFWSQSDPFQ